MIEWPEQLVLDIARRRVIVMVGSGVSRHSQGDGGRRPPTWRGFLEDALKLLNPQPKHIKAAIKRGQYLEACEWLKRALDERWRQILIEAFLTPRYRPAEIHKLVYQLDSRVYITPNFDKIFDLYSTAESEGTTIVKKHTDNDVVECIRRGDRLILKAHGSIDDTNKLIFSRKDYASARENYSAFYRLLDSLIVTNTVLMIGVGMDDPDFQLLFEDYNARMKVGLPHYMTNADGVSGDAAQTLRDTRGIKLLPYSPKSNHMQLVDSLKLLVDSVQQKRVELARNQDW